MTVSSKLYKRYSENKLNANINKYEDTVRVYQYLTFSVTNANETDIKHQTLTSMNSADRSE